MKKELTTCYQTACIMAVYKGDTLPLVAKAVESIYAQTIRVDWFVVVADGELDQEVEEYLGGQQAQGLLVLLALAENIGLGGALNASIDWLMEKHIDYVFRMDADDQSLPARFEQQLAYFECNPGVDVLGGAVVEQGCGLNNVRIPKLTHLEIVSSLPFRSWLFHPTVVFRAKIFRDGFRYPTTTRLVQDLTLWSELCRAGFVFANLPDVLLIFNLNENFFRRRGFKRNRDELKARLISLRILGKASVPNYLKACAIFVFRLLPQPVIRWAYKLDRKLRAQ